MRFQDLNWMDVERYLETDNRIMLITGATEQHAYLSLLTDIRISLAANELKKHAISTETVAETVGYQSVSAFRRVFAERMGMTPGEWRRLSRKGEYPPPT